LENITSFYAHHWTKLTNISGSWGTSGGFQYSCIVRVDDTLPSTTSNTESVWNCSDDIKTTTIKRPINASASDFNSNGTYTLIIEQKEGLNIDTGNDKIYDLAWMENVKYRPNQYLGKNKQAFVIFNLPDNATLQGLDSDSDGLNDFDELFTYYTNPKWNDTDMDGMLDGDEIDGGFNPNLWNNFSTCYYLSEYTDIFTGGVRIYNCEDNCNSGDINIGRNISILGIGTWTQTGNINTSRIDIDARQCKISFDYKDYFMNLG